MPESIDNSAVRELPVTRYTPESELRHPVRLLRKMGTDLLQARELAWRLLVRDLKSQYRQSLLGYVWAFLPPLVMTFTFVFLNSQNIISVAETSIPYPAYVMIGMLLWQNFVDAMNSPLKVVTSNKAMLIKINFPREALIMAGIGEVFFNFMIRLVLLVPLYFIYDIPVSGSLMLFPVGVAGLFFLGLLIGILLTPVGLLYGDVQRGLVLVTGFWLLLTPIVYPPAKSGFAATLSSWNPVSPLLITTRNWLTAAPNESLTAFALVAGGSFVLLFFGWVLYRVSLPHLIARMGM